MLLNTYGSNLKTATCTHENSMYKSFFFVPVEEVGKFVTAAQGIKTVVSLVLQNNSKETHLLDALCHSWGKVLSSLPVPITFLV